MSLIKENNNRTEIEEIYLTSCNGTFNQNKQKFEKILQASDKKYSDDNDLNHVAGTFKIDGIVEYLKLNPNDPINGVFLEQMQNYINEKISKRNSCNIVYKNMISNSICISVLLAGKYRFNIILNNAGKDKNSHPSNKNTIYTMAYVIVQSFTEIGFLPVQESSFVIFQNLTNIANVVLQSLLGTADNNNVKNLVSIISWLLSMSNHVKDFDAIMFDKTFKAPTGDVNANDYDDTNVLTWKSFENIILGTKQNISGKKRKNML